MNKQNETIIHKTFDNITLVMPDNDDVGNSVLMK